MAALKRKKEKQGKPAEPDNNKKQKSGIFPALPIPLAVTKLLKAEFLHGNSHGRFFLFVAMAACIGLSLFARFEQYRAWEKNPSRYFVDSKPSMSSADAYLWLRYAREFEEGIYKGNDPLRLYPGGTLRDRPVPLLSYLIGKISASSGKDVYSTGIVVIPVLASLFIIPCCLYFLRIGYPAIGILAGLAGALNYIYLARTSIGSVDTDALILFFLFLASFFAALAGFGQSSLKTLLYSALAGFTLFLFHWWYVKGFVMVYLFLLVVHLFLNRVRKALIFWSVAVYLAAYSLYYAVYDTYGYFPCGSFLSGLIEYKRRNTLALFTVGYFFTGLTVFFQLLWPSALIQPVRRSGYALKDRTSHLISLLMTRSAAFFTDRRAIILAALCLAIGVLIPKWPMEISVPAAALALAAHILAMPVDTGRRDARKPFFLYLAAGTVSLLAVNGGAIFPPLYRLLRYVIETAWYMMNTLLYAQRHAVFSTVTELEKNPVSTLMAYVFTKPWMTIAGVIFFTLFFLLHLRRMLPLAPLLLIGLMAFGGANRLVMYLAPIAGAGWGYVLTVAVHRIMDSGGRRLSLAGALVFSSLPLMAALLGALFLSFGSLGQVTLTAGTGAVTGFLLAAALSPVALSLIRKESFFQGFAFYLPPVAGAAAGYLFAQLVIGSGTIMAAAAGYGIGAAFRLLPERTQTLQWCRDLALYASAAAFFLFFAWQGFITYIPSPTIPVEVFASFGDIRKKLLPHSVLFSWWDFGYAYQDALQGATYVDGGYQSSQPTELIAKGLVASSPFLLYNTISFLSGNGSRVTTDALAAQEAQTKVLDTITGAPAYILFTWDMIDKYPVMHYIATPSPLNKTWAELLKAGEIKDYIRVKCRSFIKEQMVFDCGSVQANLMQGVMEGLDTFLKGVVFVKNGQVVREIPYRHSSGSYLEVFLGDGDAFTDIYLINEEVYLSNFNQMHLLGRYNRQLYEEVYSRPPFIRLFRARTFPGARLTGLPAGRFLKHGIETQILR